MLITRILFKAIKITLIVSLVIFALYNTATYFNLIPSGTADGIMKKQYLAFKGVLTQASTKDDLMGAIAKVFLGPMNKLEKYNHDSEAYDAEQAQIAKDCKENIWVRRAMLMGEPEEKKKGCWGKGDPITRAKEAVDNLNASEQKKIDMLNSL